MGAHPRRDADGLTPGERAVLDQVPPDAWRLTKDIQTACGLGKQYVQSSLRLLDAAGKVTRKGLRPAYWRRG